MPIHDAQIWAARLYAHAKHTGELSAARRLQPFLSDDVTLIVETSIINGRDNVLEHVTGQRPGFTAYQLGAFDDPVVDEGSIIINVEFPPLGSGPSRLVIIFRFNESGLIKTIEEQVEHGHELPKQRRIPLAVRGLIDNALVNGTPMVLSYVNSSGTPEISLRGSTRVFSGTQLSIWLRSSEGGVFRAVAQHPHVALLYRDSRNRSTLVIKGVAHVEDDESVRERVYALAPEVEQLHDPDRLGAALLIDVTDLHGGTTEGSVNLQL